MSMAVTWGPGGEGKDAMMLYRWLTATPEHSLKYDCGIKLHTPVKAHVIMVIDTVTRSVVDDTPFYIYFFFLS